MKKVMTTLSILLAGIWLGTDWIATPWYIAGSSMEPTLQPGDRVLVDLWSYRHRRPRPGEIVLVQGPGDLPANAAARARHDRDLSLSAHFLFLPLLSLGFPRLSLAIPTA